jgi:hypothetical protein
MKEYKRQGLRREVKVAKTQVEKEQYERGLKNFVDKMNDVRAESISMSVRSRISASKISLK